MHLTLWPRFQADFLQSTPTGIPYYQKYTCTYLVIYVFLSNQEITEKGSPNYQVYYLQSKMRFVILFPFLKTFKFLSEMMVVEEDMFLTIQASSFVRELCLPRD